MTVTGSLSTEFPEDANLGILCNSLRVMKCTYSYRYWLFTVFLLLLLTLIRRIRPCQSLAPQPLQRHYHFDSIQVLPLGKIMLCGNVAWLFSLVSRVINLSANHLSNKSWDDQPRCTTPHSITSSWKRIGCTIEIRNVPIHLVNKHSVVCVYRDGMRHWSL